MKRLFYPAIFHSADEGGYWVTFPDFPECMTQGETLDDSYENAFDALGLCITEYHKDNVKLPTASDPKTYSLDDDSTIMLIEFDMIAYQKLHNSKSVKKTLSIPEWLNEAAIQMNVNFSQVLQDALIQKIQG